MAKAPAGKAAPDDKSKKQDPPADDKKPAAGETDDADEGTDDDAGGKKPPVKQPKTFTKAELEAEKQKAIADAQKKWEEQKDLTELERIKKENEDLKAQNRLRDARDTVTEALTKAGARSSDLLWKTLQGDLEFDDSGKLTNLEALVTGLKTDYPDQFGEAKPEGSIDGGAGTGDKKAALTMEQVKKMTKDEINENWPAVQAVMSAANQPARS